MTPMHAAAPMPSCPIAEKLTGLKGTRLWFIAYAATLAIPWALIYGRGVADACCVLIGILFLLHSAKNRRWEWLRDPVVRVALLTWAWLLLVVTPLAVQPDQSFIMAGPWIRYVLLYAALRHWVLDDALKLRWLGKWLVAMLAFVAVDTVWQYISGVSLTGNLRDEGGRLTGPFNHVKVGIFAAKMLVPAAGIYLFFSLRDGRKKQTYFAIGLLCFASIVIMLSGERTAFLSSFAAQTLTGLWFLLSVPSQRFKLACGLVAWLACLGTLSATQSWVQERTSGLYNDLSNFHASPYGELFHGGLLLGADNILTGTGLRGFREACPELIRQEKISYCNLHPHNPYIEWFAEAGLPGLLLFLALVLLLVRTCVDSLRQSSGIDRVPAVFALACLVQNFLPLMATQSSFSNWPGILLWYSVGLALASLNALPKKPGDG